MHGDVWSGATVHTHPDEVRQVHEDYIRVGADIIITIHSQRDDKFWSPEAWDTRKRYQYAGRHTCTGG